MTLLQIKNKIDNLNFWLKHNPEHSDYSMVLKDKIELEKKLNYEHD